METAKIITHRHDVWQGNGFETFDWVGDVRLPVALYDPPTDLPWPMKRVELLENGYMYAGMEFYIRTDVSFWWWTTLRVWLTNAFAGVNARLLITAHVWGLVTLDSIQYTQTWAKALELRWKWIRDAKKKLRRP